MFSEGVIGGSNIEALEVWSLSECWPAQGNADVLKIRQKNLPDNFPVCWLLLHLSRFLTGISRTAKAMWCFVDYVYNGRERERRRERERKRERRREYLAGSYYYNEMRIALHTCLPDNFLVCWPPVSALSVFHGNLPQEIWGTYFPHRESTSWNFPAKIRNSLRLIPSFDMISKFPGSDPSSRRRYVALLLAER